MRLIPHSGFIRRKLEAWLIRRAAAILIERNCTRSAVVSRRDDFHGDNAALISSAKALLALDEKGALTGDGIGGHARTIIAAFIARMAEQGERQEVACWVPSACLDKLRNGCNNSPAVLTDGPAEFNDTPLYAVPQPGQDVRGLVEALEVSVDYLDRNTLNSIASGSTCHRKMRNALATHRQAQQDPAT